MQLSTALITEFQELYQKKFGKPISLEEAELDLLSLAEVVRVAQPIQAEEIEDEK